jgi:hypothetical protein
MAKIGRPRTCECGECQRCLHRDRARERWNSLPLEERQAIIAKRDPEKRKFADVKRYYRHRDQRLAAMREWYRNNRDRAHELTRESAARNPEKARCRNIFGAAIRNKKIKRGTECQDCGATGIRIHGHHEDYSKPLEVVWVCNACHGVRHRKWKDVA